MSQDFIDEVKPIGQLFLAKLKKTITVLRKEMNNRQKKTLILAELPLKDSRNYNHHQVINNYNMP